MEQKRGPNGERLCFWCEKPVPPPKRSFCSQECVHEWRLRTDPRYLRRCVFERDQGVCALCGLDTEALRRELEALPWWEQEERRATLRIPPNRRSLWDADHILPVSNGGGECGLDNIRTLCIWCHRKETGKLLRKAV